MSPQIKELLFAAAIACIWALWPSNAQSQPVRVVELVDITDSKSVGVSREGSTPSSDTNPWWLVVPATSWHESSKEYNENNWGVGLEYKFNQNWSATGGTYHNSKYERTWYGAFVYSPSIFQFKVKEALVKPGLLAGLFSGYADNKLLPVLAPSLQVEVEKKIGIDLLFGCEDLRCKDGFIGLSFKFNQGVLE